MGRLGGRERGVGDKADYIQANPVKSTCKN